MPPSWLRLRGWAFGQFELPHWLGNVGLPSDLWRDDRRPLMAGQQPSVEGLKSTLSRPSMFLKADCQVEGS
jgi:hypothetical protein